MIGLHSCGDLSPAMMRLFLGNMRFHSLLLVSCCYHRMTDCESKKRQFPLSDSLKKSAGIELPGISYLLRLASQETPRLWLHQNFGQRQIRSTFYRSILECYSVNGSSILRDSFFFTINCTVYLTYSQQRAFRLSNRRGELSNIKKRILALEITRCKLLRALDSKEIPNFTRKT